MGEYKQLYREAIAEEENEEDEEDDEDEGEEEGKDKDEKQKKKEGKSGHRDRDDASTIPSARSNGKEPSETSEEYWEGIIILILPLPCHLTRSCEKYLTFSLISQSH